MQAPQTFLIGQSTVIIESPDTMMMEFVGAIDKKVAGAFIEHAVAWSQGQPYALFLLNVTKMQSMSADARKVMISNGHRMPIRAMAVFGGSFATQVIMGMLDRASWLMGSKNRRTRHWSDEQSARAWLAEMRETFLTNARAFSVP